MNLLEIDSVNFSYGENQILSDIYLKVSTGEIIGILGRNGCGKSTLLKIIFGSLKGASQSVRINGAHCLTVYQTRKIRLLPQEMMVPGYLRVKSCAHLFDSTIDKLKSHPEVEQHWENRLSELSSGLAKFVETLIILYSPVKFILLDEPFSFLSPVLVERLIPVLTQVSAEKGIVLTDHQYESVVGVSDCLYLLRQCCLFPVSGREELQDYGYLS